MLAFSAYFLRSGGFKRSLLIAEVVRRVSAVRTREEGALRSRHCVLGDTPNPRVGSGRRCGPPGARVHWPGERTMLSSAVVSPSAVRSVADRRRTRRAMPRVVTRCRFEAGKVERSYRDGSEAILLRGGSWPAPKRGQSALFSSLLL